MDRDPTTIFESTTPQVKALVGEILEIEREYQHFQNLSKTGKNAEICKRIISLLEKETDK